MASRKKGISAGTTCPAHSLASTRRFNGWSKEGYERYNILYQRIKKDRQELGASFDYHVKMYDEQLGKRSLEDHTKAEDYVLPFTMNDFDEEEDGHDDDSQSPDRFTAADEESIKSKATQAACLDASAVYSAWVVGSGWIGALQVSLIMFIYCFTWLPAQIIDILLVYSFTLDLRGLHKSWSH